MSESSAIISIHELVLPEEPCPDSLGRWTPPFEVTEINEESRHHVYRLSNDGELSHAQEYCGMCRDRITFLENEQPYCTTSIVYCHQFSHFAFVHCDMSDENSIRVLWESGFGKWYAPKFDHEPSDDAAQIVTHCGGDGDEYLYGNSPVNWMKDLGLDYCFKRDRDSEAVTSCLQGSPSTIIGLIAFSCKPNTLLDVLTSQQKAWDGWRWRHHSQPHGRIDHRGLVVRVYQDPLMGNGAEILTCVVRE